MRSSAPSGLPAYLQSRWLDARAYLVASGITRPLYAGFSPVTAPALRESARTTRGEAPVDVAPEPTAHDLAEDALRKALRLPAKARTV
jgi:hypothetical protein